MKKRYLLVTLFFLSLVGLTACGKESLKKESLSDAQKFKEEYESLNGTKREKDGKMIRSIEILEDNPFIYKEASDIVKMIEEKETFVVYFGFSDCPWCRSMISNLVDVTKELGLHSVYYVDIKEIRDTMMLSDEGKAVIEQKGSTGYYDLLEALDSILAEYTLTNQDGTKVNAGEKRIYAPSVISIVDGKAMGITDGISEKQTDGYMQLTNEMNQESFDKIKCTIQCVVDNQKVCSAKASC